MVYLLAAVNLAFRARWSPVKTVLVMLAGTIPFLSFVAERKVTRLLHAQ
jgi:integral membrane protein